MTDGMGALWLSAVAVVLLLVILAVLVIIFLGEPRQGLAIATLGHDVAIHGPAVIRIV